MMMELQKGRNSMLPVTQEVEISDLLLETDP